MEWFGVIWFYYRKEKKFLWIDLLFLRHYFFKSPHRLCRAFHQHNIYGETPVTTMAKIAKECRLLSHDLIYDLGCGPGRATFWLHLFVKCRVVGIDHVPSLIEKAMKIKHHMRLGAVNFQQADMREVDLSSASAIYLYGTCLDDATINELIAKFSTLSRGTKIITVSYPLTDYSTHFRVDKTFKARFPWGKASLFLNTKI